MTYIGSKECYFFDLGGDRALVGKDLAELRNHCQGKSVAAFLSHFDKDHIQFYRLVHRWVPFGRIFVSHDHGRTGAARNLIEFFRKNQIPIIIFKAGQQVTFHEGILKSLWTPPQVTEKDENSHSLVLQMMVKGKSLLLTGDFPGRWERSLLQAVPTHVDILKVAHHGSHKSTFNALLQALRPQTCIISVGSNNKYGHPRMELLHRLQDFSCAILRTDRLGTVRLNF